MTIFPNRILAGIQFIQRLYECVAAAHPRNQRRIVFTSALALFSVCFEIGAYTLPIMLPNTGLTSAAALTLMVLVYLIAGGVRTCSSILTLRMSYMLGASVPSFLFERFTRLPLSMTRGIVLGGDVSLLTEKPHSFIVGQILPFFVAFQSCLVCIGVVIIMTIIAPAKTAVLVPIILGIYFAVWRLSVRRFRKLGDLINASERAMSGQAGNLIHCFRTIFNRERYGFISERYRLTISELQNARADINVLAQLPRFAADIILPAVALVFAYTSSRSGLNAETEKFIAVGLVTLMLQRVAPSLNSVYQGVTAMASNLTLLNEMHALVTAVPVEEDSGSDAFRFTSLEVSSVVVSFRADCLIQMPDICIRRGEILGVRGRSGCGKSTLLDLLMLLQSPTRGSILLNGSVISHQAARNFRRAIGYVPQRVDLFHGSIVENILVDPDHGVSHQRLNEVLALVGLEHIAERLETPAEALSGGQRQRVLIARALINNPQVLIFDEPTSALDEHTSVSVFSGIIEKARRQNQTVIVVSHDSNVLAMCSSVVEIGV